MKRKNKQTFLTSLISALAFVVSFNVLATEVMVFTDSKHPVLNQGEAAIFVLDDWQRIEAKLSEGLPNDEEAATKMALERIKSPQGLAALEQLVAAQKGVLMAWQMGVMKVPAVVVDGKYVVYGVANVQRALDLIASYRAGAAPVTDAADGIVLPTLQLPVR